MGVTDYVLESRDNQDHPPASSSISQTFMKRLRPWKKAAARISVDEMRREERPAASAQPLPPKLSRTARCINFVKEYGRFVGPGFMVSVAYMDPGNYSTDVSAGAQFEFKLLFVILLSSVIAVFLQNLAIKLGTVTGRDLAQISRDEFPRWINLSLYLLAEAAIICTDIAEVIGTAVALNILLRIPLIAGVVITIVDVLVVLLAHRPGKNSMRVIRMFEYGITLLVFGVVICFAVELSRIPSVPVGHVFKGFLPSSTLTRSDALYASCGILGATVMPHSLYLGSSIVKPRLLDYDVKNGNVDKELLEEIEDGYYDNYRPSVTAINWCMKFSVIELSFSLLTFAMFVNAAILVVAGATIYGTDMAADADLYTIHDTLSNLLSAGAGTVFMLALLFSGQSAGIICTIAGQIVSEGYLNWTIKPWMRRLITRMVAIVPCLVVAGAVGRTGLNRALNASQVALSILLPFLVAPLVYFTCKQSVMTIPPASFEQAQAEAEVEVTNAAVVVPVTSTRAQAGENDQEVGTTTKIATTSITQTQAVPEFRFRAGKPLTEAVSYRNNWFTAALAIAVWLFITILNVYLIVSLGMGRS
jgi:metal iron transporter